MGMFCVFCTQFHTWDARTPNLWKRASTASMICGCMVSATLISTQRSCMFCTESLSCRRVMLRTGVLSNRHSLALRWVSLCESACAEDAPGRNSCEALLCSCCCCGCEDASLHRYPFSVSSDWWNRSWKAALYLCVFFGFA